MSRRDRGPSGTAFVISHESDPERRDMSINLIALAVTRSLGRHAVPVVRIHPNRLDYSLASRYCEVALSPDMYRSESALLDYLLELASRYSGKRVLIPASDDCAQFIGEHHGALAGAYELCAAESKVMALLVSKRRQYEQAQRLGIPIPETYFPRTRDEVEAVAAKVRNYPYIIKPLVAHQWRLASMQHISKGRKAVLVRTADELRAAYGAFRENANDIMLQEVVGGPDGALFTFLGYFAKDSTPLAYCVRSKIRQMPLDFGYCTMTVSCHNDVVVDQAMRLLRGIGYSGICGVEFKLDTRTGEHKLIEINARPVNTIGLAPACGVDIPYVAYRDLIGQSVEPQTNWRDGVLWYRVRHDFHAVRQLRGKGGPSYAEWWRSLWGDHTEAVIALDDLWPVFHYFSGTFAWKPSDRADKRLMSAPGRPAKY